MKGVLSYIVQKRFSMENENIATEALNYIIQSSDSAREGLMKILRGINFELPSLRFETQQSEENLQPDMWGYEGSIPRVFIENKFWAGLTEHQPLGYLNLLSKYDSSTILLVVAPEARQTTLCRELFRRIRNENVSISEVNSTVGTSHVVKTGLGPMLAITSWEKLLNAIEAELTEEPITKNDLMQLRSLCKSAEDDAFIPIASEELTNQRFPELVLQLNTIVKETIELGITEDFINTEGLRPTHNWDSIGQYISFPRAYKVGAWLGIKFNLWREHGNTPLWLLFSPTDWGRAFDVRPILEPWAKKESIFTTLEDNYFAIAIDLKAGEELQTVARDVASQLKQISEELSNLEGC